MPKEAYVKIYQATTPSFTRVYKGFSIDYAFDSITSQVNSGYGSLTFSLPREFDALNASDPQNLAGYELDVVVPQSNGTDLVIFSGEVVIADSVMTAGGEGITYTAASPLERIEKIDLVDADSIVSYSATEIGTIMKDIIDKCNARAGRTVLSYTGSSIANTGKNLTISFNNAFVGDALKAVFKATDSDWIWYIDADKTVYLKQVSSTPDHYFFNSKDISALRRTIDRTKVINTVKFWDGENPATVAREYRRASSIDSYGLYVQNVRDGRYTTTAGADEYGIRLIDLSAEPNDQLEFTIIDSSGGGYPIDTIKVGDTFQALNFKPEANLPSLMIVTSKTDYLDYCVITASDKESFVSRELIELKKQVEQINYQDGVSAYSVVNV